MALYLYNINILKYLFENSLKNNKFSPYIDFRGIIDILKKLSNVINLGLLISMSFL